MYFIHIYVIHIMYVFYKYLCIYIKFIDRYVSENENHYAKVSIVHKILLGLSSLSCSEVRSVHPDIWVNISDIEVEWTSSMD